MLKSRAKPLLKLFMWSLTQPPRWVTLFSPSTRHENQTWVKETIREFPSHVCTQHSKEEAIWVTGGPEVSLFSTNRAVFLTLGNPINTKNILLSSVTRFSGHTFQSFSSLVGTVSKVTSLASFLCILYGVESWIYFAFPLTFCFTHTHNKCLSAKIS